MVVVSVTRLHLRSCVSSRSFSSTRLRRCNRFDERPVVSEAGLAAKDPRLLDRHLLDRSGVDACLSQSWTACPRHAQAIALVRRSLVPHFKQESEEPPDADTAHGRLERRKLSRSCIHLPVTFREHRRRISSATRRVARSGHKVTARSRPIPVVLRRQTEKGSQPIG